MPYNDASHQSTSGLHALLSTPWVYQLSQIIMGIRRLMHRLVHDHIQPQPGHHILDIGCGPADILAILPKNVHYTGYDLDPNYIAVAQRRFGARGQFLNERFDQYTVISSSQKYDRVLAIGFLHHVSDESAHNFFKAAKNALAPGGKVITIDICHTPHQPWYIRALNNMDRGRHVRNAGQYKALATGIFSEIRQTLRDDLLYIPRYLLVQECFP